MQERTGTGAQTTVLSATGLSKAVGGQQILRDVSLSVQRNELYGFLGPNGAGKTTTMRLALGLATPDDGVVQLFGAPPSNESLERTGVLFEYNTMRPSWTVRDNLVTTCNMRAVSEDRIDNCLEEVRLDPAVADRTFDSLSKGMQRKASLADALLADPELLILDEPTSGLDPQSRRAIVHLLQRLQSSGRTIVLSSHDLDIVSDICDRVCLIRNGTTLLETAVTDEIALLEGSYPDLKSYRVAENRYVLTDEIIRERELTAEVSKIDIEELYFSIMRGER